MKNDNEFESAFAALRSESARPEAALEAKRALSAPRKDRRLSLVGVPIAVVAATALFIAIPRPSAAAEFGEVMDALKKAGTWMATVYETDKNGERPTQIIASNGVVYKTTYLEGGTFKNTLSEDALAFVGGKRYNFFPAYTYIDNAGAEKKVGPEEQIQQMIQSGLISDVLAEKNLVVEGRKLDKYTVTWAQRVAGGRSGKIAVFTEPGTKRPVKMIGLLGNSVGLHTEWSYKNVPAELLKLEPKPGNPSYDLIEQRKVLADQVKNAPKGDGVRAIGAWADVNGLVMVVTTGDAGIPFTGVQGFRIAGLPEGERSFMSYNERAHAANNEWDVPRSAYGLDTLTHVTIFKGQIPDEITVSMPVWTELGNYEPKTVTFTLPVRRTFSVLTLVMPENRPFFETVQ